METTLPTFPDNPDLQVSWLVNLLFPGNWVWEQNYILTGSAYVCDPPVYSTDRDVVIVYTDEIHSKLTSNGFSFRDEFDTYKYPNSSVVQCYRQGALNVVAVKGPKEFQDWNKATRLAAEMNLLDKRQRVVLFQFITEGVTRDTGIEY